MISINVRVELPDELERKARAAGLLTSEKIAALIEAEVERQRDAAIQAARETLAKLDTLEPKMTEDEIAHELGKTHPTS